MLSVRELTKLELLSKADLLAGENGLDKIVESVGILEYESVLNLEDSFHKGDFIVSTLFFAKDDKKFAEKSIKKVIDRNISAFAIKGIFHEDISDDLKKYANKKKVPIFVFKDIVCEDILVSIMEAVKENRNYIVYENLINNLLNDSITQIDSQSIALNINSSFKNNVVCSYLTIKENNEINIVHDILERSKYRSNKVSDERFSTLLKFRRGILMIFSYDENRSSVEKSKLQLLEYYNKIGVTTDKFNIGESSSIYTLSQLNLAIKESIYANESCKNLKNSKNSYGEIGIDKVIIPFKDYYWSEKFSSDVINLIRDFDKDHNGELLKTLKIYIKNNGEMTKTSKELFQHINTTRYRIKKIKELLNIEEYKDAYEYLYLAIKIDEIDL